MTRTRIILIVPLIFVTTSIHSRDITLYCTIFGKFATVEAAQTPMSEADDTEQMELIEQNGKFYLVSGLFDRFEDALPENPAHTVWNKSWKHVLPVKSTAEEARQMGFEIPLTITRQIKTQPDFAALPVGPSLANVLQNATARVQEIGLQTEPPENERRLAMIAILEPQLKNFAAIAERGNPEDAAFAQYWLAKTCYIKGVALSVERLPKATFNHERHAWAQEELCYDSAMEVIDTFLERFPNDKRAEEIAYLKAATAYHLTYRGHHRHQVELAKQGYQNFIDQYPNSVRVPRAKLNLLGISLELARMDEDGFAEVIELGESLLAEYPGANDYIRSRAALIVAESYYEGENPDYNKTIEDCDRILEEFIDSERRSVIGTAFRLKAYSHYFLGR